VESTPDSGLIPTQEYYKPQSNQIIGEKPDNIPFEKYALLPSHSSKDRCLQGSSENSKD